MGGCRGKTAANFKHRPGGRLQGKTAATLDIQSCYNVVMGILGLYVAYRAGKRRAMRDYNDSVVGLDLDEICAVCKQEPELPDLDIDSSSRVYIMVA